MSTVDALGHTWDLAPQNIDCPPIPALDTHRLQTALKETPGAGLLRLDDGAYAIGSGIHTPLFAAEMLKQFVDYAEIEQADLAGEVAVVIPLGAESMLAASFINHHSEGVRETTGFELCEARLKAFRVSGRRIFRVDIEAVGRMPAALQSELALTASAETLAQYTFAPPPNRWLLLPFDVKRWPPTVASLRSWLTTGGLATAGAGTYAALSLVSGMLAPSAVEIAPEPEPAVAVVETPQTDEPKQRLAVSAPPAPKQRSSVKWDIAAFSLLVENQLWADVSASDISWTRSDVADVKVEVRGVDNPRWNDAAQVWDAQMRFNEAPEAGAPEASDGCRSHWSNRSRADSTCKPVRTPPINSAPRPAELTRPDRGCAWSRCSLVADARRVGVSPGRVQLERARCNFDTEVCELSFG